MLSAGAGGSTGSGYMIPPYLSAHTNANYQVPNSGGQYAVPGANSSQQTRLDYMIRHSEENSPPPQYYKQPGMGYSSKETSIDALPTTRKR